MNLDESSIDKSFCFANAVRVSSPTVMTWALLRPLRLAHRARRLGGVVWRAGLVTLWGLAVCAVWAGAGGCQQMAAAQAAKNAVPAAQEAMRTAQTAMQGAEAAAQKTVQATTQVAEKVVNSIPGSQIAMGLMPKGVQDQANNMLRARNLDWGKPKRVFMYDGMYILVYSDTGLFGPGKPKVLVIDTVGAIARLERLQYKGY